MATTIEIDMYVSPYCPHCDAMLGKLIAMNTVHGRPVSIRKRDVLEHLEAAVAAGVRATPAFVLDGRHLASGRLTPTRLRKILEDLLAEEANEDTHDR